MLRSAQASSPGPGEIASASASEDKLREQDALELREADLRAEEQRLSTAEKALALRKSALLEKTGALDERERKLVEKEAAVASLNAPAGRKHPRTVAPVGLLEARLFEEEGVHRAEEKKLTDTVHGLESQLAAKSREQSSLKARVNTLRKALKRSAEPAVTAQSELVDARTQLVSLQEARATLDGQRVAANERRLAEREARLTALETRLVAAGTPPELLQTGDAGRKQLSAAVRSHQRDLKHCLEDELKLTQSANASHVLQITLDARGRVTRAEVPGAADSPIEKCLKNAASAWRFPASDKDYDLEIPLHVGGRGGL